MSKTLTDTMHAAKDGMKSAQQTTAHALGAAAEELGSAKKTTLAAFAGGLSSVLEGAALVGTLFTTLRKLDGDDGLAWLGLSRRRSTLSSVLLFGAGATAGAGFALLFAPMSGIELRKALFQRAPAGPAQEKSPGGAEASAPRSERTSATGARQNGAPVDGVPESGTSVHG